MATYKQRVYSELIPDEYYGSHPNKDEQLKTEYKGFQITKRNQYNLFSIVVPTGKQLNSMLAGEFSKMEILKTAVDKYIAKYGDLPAFTDIEAKRGRGRPKKEITI